MEAPNFSELMKLPEHSSLTSKQTYDAADGNATTLANKSSLWIVSKEALLRICNIATSNVDGVIEMLISKKSVEGGLKRMANYGKKRYKGKDYSFVIDEDFGISSQVISSALLDILNLEDTVMYMNSYVMWQLSYEKMFIVRDDKYFFMKAECKIDNSIKCNERTVV